MTYAIGGSVALSGLFAYIASSPAIFMEGYGVSNKGYGLIFALITLGFVGLSQCNGLLGNFFKAEQIILGAVTLMAILSFIFFYGLGKNWFGFVETAAFIFLILGCIGIINPNAAALSMAPFTDNAGSAASLFGFIQWGIAGLISVIIGSFDNDTALPLAGILTVSSVMALVILYFGGRFVKRRAVSEKS